MVDAGMADGMSEGYERLDELLVGAEGDSTRTADTDPEGRSTTMQKITPCLWFDTQAEEAANFYVSLLEDSEVTDVQRLDGTPSGDNVALVFFRLAGQEFMAINGGPQFPFTEAVSFSVSCKDQDEVDRLWSALTADGGEEGQCGWLKDRFGLSWQIIPERMGELLSDPDPGASPARDAGDAPDAEDRPEGDGGRGQRVLSETPVGPRPYPRGPTGEVARWLTRIGWRCTPWTADPPRWDGPGRSRW